MSLSPSARGIPLLPIDVLENILQHLDGITFSVCRQVCKSWRVLIDGLTVYKRSNFWRKFCVQEIPSGTLEDFLHSKSLDLAQKTLIEWRSIYKQWFTGQQFKNKPVVLGINRLSSGGGSHIMCVKISGTCIITGHAGGEVCVWSTFKNEELLQNVQCHMCSILDIELVDLHCLGSYHGLCEGTWSHHHMITVSKDTLIRIKCLLEPLQDDSSDILLHKHGAATTSVKVFGERFAVSSNDNTVSLWSMKVTEPSSVHLTVSLLKLISGPADSLVQHHLWHDQVSCISTPGLLKVYSFSKDEWTHETRLLHHLSPNDRRRLCYSLGVYIFHSNIAFMFIANAKMVVSIDDNTRLSFNLMKCLGTEITSLSLCCNVMAVGGDNGRLFLYHVPDARTQFPDLARPAYKVQLSPVSITSVCVAVQEEGVVVAAATSESLYVVKLQR